MLTILPAGYRADPKGRLVPEDSIKEIDKLRDDLVNELVEKALPLQRALVEFRTEAMNSIKAFAELSAEKYGVSLGGRKGNMSLTSFDGSFRILLNIDDYLVFDERLQAAKALIDECLHEWTKDSRHEIRALIGDAFQVDKQGKINTGRVLGLRRLDIQDPKWKLAMDAISESVQVAASKEYVRIYRRTKDDQYELISLDLASA